MPQVVTVYINGENKLAKFVPTLANVLYGCSVNNNRTTAICMNGDVVDHPDVHAPQELRFNLEKALDDLAEKLIKKLVLNQTLILNLFGYCHGAAAVFLLCQKLKQIPAERLEINVCAIEPISDNGRYFAYADTLMGTQVSVSSQIADLSACLNVKQMLVLFSNDPTEDQYFHTPLLPIKPQNAKMIVDVIPGGHHNTDQIEGVLSQVAFRFTGVKLAFFYAQTFLEQCKTRFLEVPHWKIPYADFGENTLLNLMVDEKNSLKPSVRKMHYCNQINTKPEKLYLNLLHQKLSGVQQDSRQCALTVQDVAPQARYRTGQKNLMPVGFSRGFFLVGAAATVYATSCALQKQGPATRAVCSIQ